MANRKHKDPSPLKAGILHGFLSSAVFGGAFALIAGGVHLTGNPEAAGPSYVVSLFQSEAIDIAALRTRRTGTVATRLGAVSDDISEGEGRDDTEPNLGVADPQSYAAINVEPRATKLQPVEAPRGIRINGKLVNPGQSLSEVDASTGSGGSAQLAIPAKSDAVTVEPANLSTLKNTRPFQNPQNKPIVSLIVGGLGTSASQARAAINELPAEVTLSFVPNASADLLRYARQKGHEILIEVPMEASVRGRARPYNNTLLANAPGDQNVLRLEAVLRGKTGAFGVITDKGDKFAANEAASAPILEHLAKKNIAFFQHSNLPRANFAEVAKSVNLDFAQAQINIDTEQRVSAINEQLFRLETAAQENGAALGTGFSFPVTVDTIARWAYDLGDKGIVLAPASAYAATVKSDAVLEISQLDLEGASLQDAPSP